MTSPPHTILYLNTSSSIGGAERSLLDLLTGMDRSRFCPVVACPDDGPLTHALNEKGVEVHSCGFSGLSTPFRFFSELLNLRRFSRERNVVLIHGNSTLAVKHTIFLGRVLGVPSVVHVRDEIPPGASFYRLWLCYSDCVIAISDAVKMALINTVTPAALKRIYNGINTERFRPDLNGFDARLEWQWPEKTPVVGMVGRFSFEKGVKTFIVAASQVVHEFPAARFILVGDVVFSKNRRFKEEAIATAHRLHLPDRIKFVGERENVETLMAGMDILIVPSTREAFGRVAAEAGACGKPVVATAVGGLSEIVKDGETGILVPPEDCNAMAAAILKLLKDEGLRRTMGIKARERICKLFDIRRTIDEIENLYRTLLKEEGT